MYMPTLLSIYSRRFVKFGLAAVVLACELIANLSAALVTSPGYRVVGMQLRVTPAVLSVSESVAGSVLVELPSGANTNSPLAQGAFVVIDEQNFRALEFKIDFSRERNVIPRKSPIMAPSFERFSGTISIGLLCSINEGRRRRC
jgi:hypothetical protein